MTEVTVRSASVADAEAIAPMHRSCWHEAYTGLVPQRCLDDLDRQDRVARWRDRLTRAEDGTLVAVQDAAVVGLATIGPSREAHPLPPVELRSLYVSRVRWGNGLGAALLQRAVGDGAASLWVFEGNGRARAFYARAGWVPTGERRVDDWTLIPELRLVRSTSTG